MAQTLPPADKAALPFGDRPLPPRKQFRFAGLVRPPRPPQPLDPLPPYGVAYFHQLLSQYETFPAGGDDPAACLHVNPKAEAVLHKLEDRAAHGSLTWADMDRLEVALLHVLPEAILRNVAWSLRARYFEVAGPALTTLYKQSKPASWDDATAPVEALRADLECLNDEILKYRTFLPARDQVRDHISRNAASWTLGTTLAGAVFFVAAHVFHVPAATAPALTMMLAMLSGGIGGFVSMQGRLQKASPQSLPVLDRIELETERFSLYLSPVSGAIFAAVLYFLFLGRYLEGALFPHVDQASLLLPINFGGLIVWSFLAGFAERLVPDVLTRLVARSDATSDKTPPKT